MDEETWKKGEELIKKMPKLKTDNWVGWNERGVGDNFMLLCTLLKGNAIPAKGLYLNCIGEEEK